MWSYVVPILLDRRSSEDGTFNLLLHSQRGHGLSTLPPRTEGQQRLTTVPLQAMDIYHLMEALAIPTPVHAVIGVSQGGATTLAFTALYGDKTRSVVVCDTAARTPPGNKEAWEQRIALVCGTSSDEWYEDSNDKKVDVGASAEKECMRKLAKVTLPRWFPKGSECHPGSDLDPEDGRLMWVEEMVVNTDVRGFFQGAKALGSYDVLEIEIETAGGEKVKKRLFDTGVEQVLLVAGRVDGGGKVAKGLRGLREGWIGQGRGSVEFVEIGESGHLPMIDSPDAFGDVVASFLCDGTAK
jgi:pimeloyl-ACP methyl ester carboxylesterase